MPQDKQEIEFVVGPIAKKHKRADFSCGGEPLDRYPNNQASQDAKKGVAAPFVLVTPVNKVIGYYTLSAFSIELEKLPQAQVRKLPKYPVVPATLLGRLATDQNYRGLGLGEHLLMDALHRSFDATSQIASYAVVVDAKDDGVVVFYKKYGFQRFQDYPNLEPFVIAKAGKPMVKVVPLDSPDAGQQKRLGFLVGQIKVPDDFDTMGIEEIQSMFQVDS